MEINKNARLLTKYLIEVEDKFKKVYLNGKEIYMDNTYNDLANAQTVGRIVSLPLKNANPKLKVGDYVLLHHFATDDGRAVKVTNDDGYYFSVEENFMYMAYNKNFEDLRVIGDFCILEKEEDKEEITDSGLYVGTTNKKEDNEGVVIACCEAFTEYGGSVGDTVMFQKGVDYDITLPNGKTYYRVRANSIYASIDG